MTREKSLSARNVNFDPDVELTSTTSSYTETLSIFKNSWNQIIKMRAALVSGYVNILGGFPNFIERGDVNFSSFEQEIRYTTIKNLASEVAWELLRTIVIRNQVHLFNSTGEAQGFRFSLEKLHEGNICGWQEIIVDAKFLPHKTAKVSRTVRRRMLEREIKSHVRHHCSYRTVNISEILRLFGVSRATLFRMFREHGGVHRFQTRVRLGRAYLDILAADVARGTVSRIARRYQFEDMANFTNSFRSEFGKAPSSLLGLGFESGAQREREFETPAQQLIA